MLAPVKVGGGVMSWCTGCLNFFCVVLCFFVFSSSFFLFIYTYFLFPIVVKGYRVSQKKGNGFYHS